MKKINLFVMILMVLILSGCGKNGNVDFNKTDTVTFHNLTLEIPKDFIKDSENSTNNIVFYSYDDTDKYNSCMLYLSLSNYPKSDIKKAIQDGFLGKTDFTYNEKNINGNKWSIGYREQSIKSSQSFYVINNNGKEYSLSYEDFGSGEDCAKALKVIENSLKFN